MNLEDLTEVVRAEDEETHPLTYESPARRSAPPFATHATALGAATGHVLGLISRLMSEGTAAADDMRDALGETFCQLLLIADALEIDLVSAITERNEVAAWRQ